MDLLRGTGNEADDAKEASRERKRGHDGRTASDEEGEDEAVLEHNTFVDQMAERLASGDWPSYDVVDVQLQHIYDIQQ